MATKLKKLKFCFEYMFFAAYQHISKVIEVSRVHLFDIVTQYRAIFSDDDPLPAYRRSADDNANETGMFHSWILHKVPN